MFILPIRTSIRPWRTPYANYALIAVNIAIFVLTYWPHVNPFTHQPEILRLWAEHFMLTPGRPYLWQFITYAFLHGGILHIIGNMFFLYLFGNNVNDRLGHIGYVCFYLAGAVFSGAGHALLRTSPVLGASGAVAAVTGAYVVLFPQSLITVFYWLLFFINTVEIPAIYFIGFKLIFWDNIAERRMRNVAYDAHLSGYAFGIAAVTFLLATGLMERSGFDLWSMVKQWNRRRRYRDSVAGGYDPFEGQTAKPMKVKVLKQTPAQQQQQEKIRQLCSDIGSRIAERNISAAADIYLELMKIDSQQVLPRQHLLDIANQLASDNRHAESANAYEQFLTHYKNYVYAEQVQLMLGILYSRYLNNPKLARKHLQAAAEKLTDPAQLKMCNNELVRLKS
ncbi:MAG TPA: rhomboid family intramembrane serine protease [Sedimentisphaerales bacterium]|nr:rhomboid family intramembrane serine protease [Sedimentisphaerales bacterium]